MPTQMKDSLIVPEQLRSFGAPWQHAMSACSYRGSSGGTPFSHLGGFHYSTDSDHEHILCAWPVSSVLDLNVKPSASTAFLGSLSASDFSKWAVDHVWHCSFGEGRVAWLPYGWHHLTFALAAPDSESDVVFSMYQPVVSPRLFAALEQRVKDSMLDDAHWWVNATRGTAPFATLYPAYIAWLTTHGCKEAGATQVVPDGGSDSDLEHSDNEAVGPSSSSLVVRPSDSTSQQGSAKKKARAAADSGDIN